MCHLAHAEKKIMMYSNVSWRLYLKHIIFLCIYVLFSCNLHAVEQKSVIVHDDNSIYTQAIQLFYPKITIESSVHASAMQHFSNGKNIEAYKNQAVSITNFKNTYQFEEHYVKTVIIAIDRDVTSERIESFKDVFNSDLEINFSFGEESAFMLWDLPNAQNIVLSMSMALYGEYDVHAIAKNFKALYRENRFFVNDNSKAVSIMYDSDAVNLIKSGRNIEIVIPKDGTHSFVGGLLSNGISLSENPLFTEYLHKMGLRVPNARHTELYPHNEEYIHAKNVTDTQAFNSQGAHVGSILRREAFGQERFGFEDNKERTSFFLVFIFFLLGYIISINRRVTNLRIRHAIVVVCSLQIILVSMGCLKALTVDNPIVETILWYGYYFAFVYIPAIYLYVALVSGRNREVNAIPTLYKIYFFISTLFVLFVCTNNIHGLVFIVYNYTNSTFDYNWGYYIVMGWIYVTLCVSLGILMYKVFLMPRKRALVLPFIMNIVTITWLVGYARRIPIFYDLDFAYSINIIIILYIEACIQGKLFPSNSQYRKMFSNSKLCMEIKDNKGVTVERSLTSIEKDREYVLRQTKMQSGTFLYYEDYTELHKANEKLHETNEQLKENNELLKKQSEVKAELASLAAEKAVYENIDSVLSYDTAKVDSLLIELEKTSDSRRVMGRINIVVCGIKRKCILRINTLNQQNPSVKDFLNYIGEMQEFAKLLPLKITIGCRVNGTLPIKQAIEMYELFCSVVELAALNESSDILVQLYEEGDFIIFSVIPDKRIDIANIADISNENLTHYGEELSIKPWYESTAVLLSYKKEVV